MDGSALARCWRALKGCGDQEGQREGVKYEQAQKSSGKKWRVLGLGPGTPFIQFCLFVTFKMYYYCKIEHTLYI
jgi:hypothetical protein